MLDSNGSKFMTRVRHRLSYLDEHKFNYNFKDWVNLDSVSHFFLHCYYFTDIRKTIFNESQSIDENRFESIWQRNSGTTSSWW